MLLPDCPDDRRLAIGYRPDIDGLRAIAVLGVVLFHLKISSVSGGFVGVDVFFVISGYLISKIVFNDTAEHRFSIVKFYERRARRILPAYLFVSLMTVVAAYLCFYPPELVDFARSLLAATFFVANIFFFVTLDYFSPAADRLPLLHTWSLAVEEQFYLFFPIFVIGIQKYAPRLLKLAVIVCLVASLLGSGLLTHLHPAGAFFLLPSRVFELMIGSFLAHPTTRMPSGKAQAIAATLAGFCALIVALFFYRQTMDFPGFAAALPCAGAGLLIWGGTSIRPWPSRLLGAMPLRAIGRMSYSLYLLHWPVIVFGTQMLPPMNEAGRDCLLLAVSMILAVVSFYCVEQPVRFHSFWCRRRVFIFSLVAILIPSGIAADLIAKDGYPARFDAKVSQIIALLPYDPADQFREGQCFLGMDQRIVAFNQTLCLPASGKKSIILWGDSAAADLYSGLAPEFEKSGYAFGQATASSCPPIAGYDVPDRPLCRSFNAFILAKLLERKPDVLILASNWMIKPQTLDLFKTMIKTLENAGIKIVIIGPQPYYTARMPRILADRMLKGNHSTNSDGMVIPGSFWADTAMRWFSSQYHVMYIPIIDILCSAGNCRMLTDHGTPMSFDAFHLTMDGSQFIADRIVPLILNAKQTPPSHILPKAAAK